MTQYRGVTKRVAELFQRNPHGVYQTGGIASLLDTTKRAVQKAITELMQDNVIREIRTYHYQLTPVARTSPAATAPATAARTSTPVPSPAVTPVARPSTPATAPATAAMIRPRPRTLQELEIQFDSTGRRYAELPGWPRLYVDDMPAWASAAIRGRVEPTGKFEREYLWEAWWQVDRRYILYLGKRYGLTEYEIQQTYYEYDRDEREWYIDNSERFEYRNMGVSGIIPWREFAMAWYLTYYDNTRYHMETNLSFDYSVIRWQYSRADYRSLRSYRRFAMIPLAWPHKRGRGCKYYASYRRVFRNMAGREYHYIYGESFVPTAYYARKALQRYGQHAVYVNGHRVWRDGFAITRLRQKRISAPVVRYEFDRVWRRVCAIPRKWWLASRIVSDEFVGHAWRPWRPATAPALDELYVPPTSWHTYDIPRPPAIIDTVATVLPNSTTAGLLPDNEPESNDDIPDSRQDDNEMSGEYDDDE